MKIVQVHENLKSNSSPYKIKKCLQLIGEKPQIFTLNSSVDDKDVIVLDKGFIYRIKTKIATLIYNLEFSKNYCSKPGYPFTYFNVGVDISKLKEVKEADVIFLHWVCGGYISPKVLKKLSSMNKKMVWVCHDSWPFTGGCHVRMGCDRFKTGCGYCPEIQSSQEKDFSYRLLKKKIESIDCNNMIVVSPSNWMDRNVGESLLFKDCKHVVIPNPIDVEKYKKYDKEAIREKYGIPLDKKVLLFGAVNATSTPYKGYTYLVEALQELVKIVDDISDYELIVFGAESGDSDSDIPFETKYLGRLDEEGMIEAYSLSDVYITPTLDDNLPNTVMESLACEVPVVSFDTGGVSDMLKDRENGYLAKYADSKDFANGIFWVMENNTGNTLGKNGRKYICGNFSEEVVAKKYKALLDKLKLECDIDVLRQNIQ